MAKYHRDAKFIESLKEAKRRFDAWPEEKRKTMESIRRFHRQKSKETYE